MHLIVDLMYTTLIQLKIAKPVLAQQTLIHDWNNIYLDSYFQWTSLFSWQLKELIFKHSVCWTLLCNCFTCWCGSWSFFTGSCRWLTYWPWFRQKNNLWIETDNVAGHRLACNSSNRVSFLAGVFTCHDLWTAPMGGNWSLSIDWKQVRCLKVKSDHFFVITNIVCCRRSLHTPSNSLTYYPASHQIGKFWLVFLVWTRKKSLRTHPDDKHAKNFISWGLKCCVSFSTGWSKVLSSTLLMASELSSNLKVSDLITDRNADAFLTLSATLLARRKYLVTWHDGLPVHQIHQIIM